jgi:hypothetical protein
VHLTIVGAAADSGKLLLRQSETFSNPFERDHLDVFRFELVELGPLQRILVGHDNKGIVGDAWLLDFVDIEVPALTTHWKFPCGRWFGKSKDDGAIERELYPEAASGAAMHEDISAPYLLRVFTSDVASAGTDASVSPTGIPSPSHLCFHHRSDRIYRPWTELTPRGGQVSVVVYGEEGKTDEYDLANKTDNFERGRVVR